MKPIYLVCRLKACAVSLALSLHFLFATQNKMIIIIEINHMTNNNPIPLFQQNEQQQKLKKDSRNSAKKSWIYN
jgi:hypothetical protein